MVANCDHMAKEDDDVVADCDRIGSLLDPALSNVAICDVKAANSSAVS